MKKKLLVWGLAVVLVLALGMFVAACGEGTEATTTVSTPRTTVPDGTDTTVPGETTTTVAAAAPVKGGTFRIVLQDEGSGIIGIPWKIQGNQAATEIAGIDTLVRVKLDGTVEPSLATSWEVADDGKSITFQLQPNVKFIDGTACDAAAIKWNLDQWSAAGVGVSQKWESIEVVDATTLRMNLNSWNSFALIGLAEAYLGFISPTAFEANGETWAEGNLVGTGPFKLTNLDPGVGWTFEKNPDYWGGEPYLDAIDYKVVKDNNTMQMMLEAGEADIAMLPGGDPAVMNALKDKGGFTLMGYAVEEPEVLYVDGMNADSPWGNKDVRVAVDYAIDRESLAALGNGIWMATNLFVDPRSDLYDPTLKRDYDPAKAKELLAAAGYPDGFETTIWHGGGGDANIAALLQQNFAAIGITAEVVQLDGGAMFGQAMNGFHNGGMLAPYASKPGYTAGLDSWLGATSIVMASAYRSEALQALIDSAYATRTPEEAASYNKQAIALLFNDVAGYPVRVSHYSIGVKANYVMDDGYGDSSAGTWTPAKCWLNK